MVFQSFGINHQGRDFAIGDLHGMYDLLMETLGSVNFNPEKDRCFSVGDLIDRGPDSEKCLALIQAPWFFPVCGNHEYTLLSVVRNQDTQEIKNWEKNGGLWHRQVLSKRMQTYADWVEGLPLLIAVEQPKGQRVALCHGQYPLSDWAPEKIDSDIALQEDMLWSRERILQKDNSVVTGIDHIICGHTIVKNPVTLGNCHYIDTGAFEHGNLTLLSLNTLDADSC